MKYTIFILSVLMLTACDHSARLLDCVDGCTKPPADGINGLPGTPGDPGDNGNDGSDGHSLVSAVMPLAPGCQAGGYTFFLATDMNDNQVLDVGLDLNVQSAELCSGVDGDDGTDGQDGQDGADGEDAVLSPYTPVALVTPCPSLPGAHKEVFFRLNNGSLVASFSGNGSALNTRLTVIPPGTYNTTDGRGCTFTLNNDGTLSY